MNIKTINLNTIIKIHIIDLYMKIMLLYYMVRLFKFLIVGLGNPGSIYKNNRHNSGSIVLSEILKTPFLTNLELENNCVIDHLCSPSEMNSSGKILLGYCGRKQYDLMIVLVDDLETELGKVKRVYPTTGHKGQNGIRDILQYFKNNFCTIRLGIGRPYGSYSVNDFVLGDFTKNELNVILNTTEEVKKLMTEVVKFVTKTKRTDETQIG